MAITERNNAQTNPLEGGAITDSSEASQVTAKKARIQWSTVPAFVLFLFYVQVASAAALISTILGFDVSNATMCQHFLRILRTRFAHSSSSQPVLDDTTRPVIFLSNHRSWGDFWVDCALLGGPSFVSRWLVALGIPASAVWGSLSGWLWFFSRGKKRSEGTTKWMQKFLSNCHARCPGKGVVLYPEGTRSLEPKGLPLKVGGLVTAYNLGWPVQIVITTNKEMVTAERAMAIGLGICCVSSVSKPIWPLDFTTSEDFMEKVKSTWQETWDDAYGGAKTPRSSALLPGAVQKPHSCSLAASRQMQYLRLFFGLILLHRYWNGVGLVLQRLTGHSGAPSKL